MKLEASQMIPVLFSSDDTYATSMLVTDVGDEMCY